MPISVIQKKRLCVVGLHDKQVWTGWMEVIQERRSQMIKSVGLFCYRVMVRIQNAERKTPDEREVK